MLPREIQETDLNYLTALPTSGLQENNTLEYKAQINRVEQLLKEICALANSYGGDLVIGVSETNGLPSAVQGVLVPNLTLEQYDLQVAQQIRSGIEPSPSIRTNFHELPNGNYVAHIRVRQSMIGPHRLVTSHKFYERNSSASVEMTMDNLRVAFGAREGFEATAMAHHRNRSTQNPYLPQHEDVTLVFMHLVPIASLNRQVDLPVATIPPQQLVMPVSGGLTSSRIDHLGHMLLSEGGRASGLSHIGRNGIVECGLEIPLEQDDANPNQRWWIQGYDWELVHFLQRSLDFVLQHDIAGPGFVFTSIMNAEGLRGYRGRAHARLNVGINDGLSCETLVCEPIFVDDFGTPASEVIKPTLDMIWNGFGAQRCPSYQADGTWVPPVY